MRKIKEVLRLKWEMLFSDRQIARSCSISRSTVGDYLTRAQRSGLKWPLPEGFDDAALERLLYPPVCYVPPEKQELPPFEEIHRELKRKGVTLQLLWDEYKQAHPNGLQYSQFCNRYRQWAATLEVSLRQSYRAGEKLFVDYAGQTMELIDPTTGDTREAYLFVATLGASNYTYAEVTLARDLPSWISSHVRALEFFGGVPEIVVPDNPKTGVTSPCRYEPDINPTYHDMASHYGTVVIPARVARPKDKAKVESAVLVARALDTPVETGCAVQNPIDDLFAC
ncbi:MAG: IS21 family transposase [Syntrophales bacterium]|nr:IS21 family transposase [Syntrophales bacterium]MDD5531487.1 IS21 family transposase [Syntrophales bacterium]